MFSKIRLCSECGHPVDNHSVYRQKCLSNVGCPCRLDGGDPKYLGKLAVLGIAFDQLGVKAVFA